MNITYTAFARLVSMAALLLALGSCKKIDDLLDTRNGDQKLEDLLTSAPWKADSIVIGNVDGNIDKLDTILVNSGTITFDKRDKTEGPNFDIGLVRRTYSFTDSAGTRQRTDTSFWYPGVYGSTSLDGEKVTFFPLRKKDGSYEQNVSIVMQFAERGDHLLRLTGRSTHPDINNGATVGFYRKYRLSH